MERRILVIAGASGVGKTSIASHLLSESSDFGFVRSVTTRAPRGDGHDGEYIYISREEFVKKAENSELVEYMEYGDNMYGTPKSELERIFADDKIPLLILDIEGVKSLRRGIFDFSSTVFYIWEELNVIEKRLYERDLSEPTADKLLSFIKRKNANIRDYSDMPQIASLFDLFIRNIGIAETAQIVRNEFFNSSVASRNAAERNAETAEMLRKMTEEK